MLHSGFLHVLYECDLSPFSSNVPRSIYTCTYYVYTCTHAETSQNKVY